MSEIPRSPGSVCKTLFIAMAIFFNHDDCDQTHP